jgi:hypothetical protein
MSYSFDLNLPGLEMPHTKHEEHLCFLHNLGYLEKNMAGYKTLVRDARFVCRKCGRVAKSDHHLCEPEPL